MTTQEMFDGGIRCRGRGFNCPTCKDRLTCVEVVMPETKGEKTMYNPYNYTIIDHDNGQVFINDEHDTVATIIDECNLDKVLSKQWLVDKEGYFFLERNQKVHMGEYLSDAKPGWRIYYEDGNPFTYNTKWNILVDTFDEANITKMYVDGLEVFVDTEVYNRKQLWSYSYKLYQGYVVYISKRQRCYLHKLVTDMDVEPNVRIRFRNGNKLDCRKVNLHINITSHLKGLPDDSQFKADTTTPGTFA